MSGMKAGMDQNLGEIETKFQIFYFILQQTPFPCIGGMFFKSYNLGSLAISIPFL